MLIIMMELIEMSNLSEIENFSSLIEPRDVQDLNLNLHPLLDITKKSNKRE